MASTQSARGSRRSPSHAPLAAEITEAAGRGFPFYVYTLADQAGVFYVGKGRGDRVFHHERLQAGDNNHAKKARIKASGEPEKTVLAYFLDEPAAYQFERDLIQERRAGLTNMAGGTVTWEQSARARATYLLGSMKDVEAWICSLAPEKLALIERAIGPARVFYEEIRAVLVNEATNPTPLRVFVPSTARQELAHGS